MDNKVALGYLVKIGEGGALTLTIRTLLVSLSMGLSAVKKDHNYCRVPTRSSECDSRLGVRQFSGQELLETSPGSIYKNLSKIRCSQYRPFASRMSHQFPAYMVWKPDLGGQVTNAMCQPWAKMFPYAFPSFTLKPRVLSKLRKEGITMILVAPTWQSQVSYSVLLSMCIHNSLLLPHRKDLLLDTLGKTHLLVVNETLRLAAWLVSVNHWHQKAFQAKLQSLYQIPEEKIQSLLMNQPGASGLVAVVNRRMIPFDVL